MDDAAIAKVKTCLDDILRKGDVSNDDLARAIQCYLTDAFWPHVLCNRRTSAQVAELVAAIKPITEWAAPRIEREKQWREDRHKLRMHVLMWASAICCGAVGIWLLNALRVSLKLWIDAP